MCVGNDLKFQRTNDIYRNKYRSSRKLRQPPITKSDVIYGQPQLCAILDHLFFTLNGYHLWMDPRSQLKIFVLG